MRTILLAAALTAAAGLAQAQSPTNRLPNQAELPSPSTVSYTHLTLPTIYSV